MKPAALLGAAAVAAAVAIVLMRPAGQPDPAPAESSGAGAAEQQLPGRPAIATAETPKLQPAAATRPQVALHGVIYRGDDSQVLLSVDGQPEQVFAMGEAVGSGWSVRAIRPDAVVLAHGTQLATVGLAAAPAASTAALPGQPSAEAATARRLPGFVAGTPAAVNDAQAHERNRRFLDAVQARLPAR